MTKEDAIKLIRKYECNKDHYEACEMAIKALEQIDVPDTNVGKLDNDPIDIDKAVEHYEGTLETLKDIDLEVDG